MQQTSPYRAKINGIMNRWENCQRKMANPFKKEKTQPSLEPPKLIHTEDLELDFSIPDVTIEKELGDLLNDSEEKEVKQQKVEPLKESTSSLAKVGSTHFEKINKITEEIKGIRLKVDQQKSKTTTTIPPKAEIPVPKSTNPLLKNSKKFDKQVKPQLSSPFYREPVQPQIKPSSQVRQEPIHQNINCINIYNHSSHIPPYPGLSNFFQNNCPQHMDPELYGYYEEEHSLDTYDMEFQTQFDPEKKEEAGQNQAYRHTVFSPNDRDLSEYNKRKKPIDQKYKQLKAKQHVNQVCNKNYTQSAGPLQFKSFVTKLMKNQMDGYTNEQEKQQGNKQFEGRLSSNRNQENKRSLSGVKKKVEGLNSVETSVNIERNLSQKMVSASTRLPASHQHVQC